MSVMGVSAKAFGLRHPKLLGALAALFTLVADQGVKLYFLYRLGFAAMQPGEAIRVGPFFNLVMVWNRGVSFGLFPADSDAGRSGRCDPCPYYDYSGIVN